MIAPQAHRSGSLSTGSSSAPRAGIHGVIFDLDGTLVKTESLKALAYARAAADLSARPPNEQYVMDAYARLVGRPREEVSGMLARELGLPHDDLSRTWLRLYGAMLDDPRFLEREASPHSISLLRSARSSGLKTGLATMSLRPQVERILFVLGLAAAFDAIATEEDVHNGKPDPEIYLIVARRLGIAPAKCLVIEDSVAGVAAALSAGMSCIAVTSSYTAKAVRESGLLDSRWILDDDSLLPAAAREMMMLRSPQHFSPHDTTNNAR